MSAHLQKILALSIPGLVLSFAAFGQTKLQKNAVVGKPNIVIILADDQGNADCGFQRSPSTMATPSIDKIAANGVVFTQGYASAYV